MVLNLHPAIAVDLLGVVKRVIEEYKLLEAGEHGDVFESRRRSLEIVRHRLEYNLGIPEPYSNPENHAHLEYLKRRWKERTGQSHEQVRQASIEDEGHE